MSLLPRLVPDDVTELVGRFEKKLDRLIELLEQLVDRQD
jgi:hypothetical protein